MHNMFDMEDQTVQVPKTDDPDVLPDEVMADLAARKMEGLLTSEEERLIEQEGLAELVGE